MLINLSNHPTSGWTEIQTRVALEQYGSLLDIPFPHIDPLASSEEIDLLARKYVQLIAEHKHHERFAVHLMGELTFSFALCKRLQEVGISVVASTTNRVSEEQPDGTKKSFFQFFQFRPYY